MRAVAVFEFEVDEDQDPNEFQAGVSAAGRELAGEFPEMVVKAYAAIKEIADEVIELVAGGVQGPSHELQCPNCGAVIRARMAY